MAGYAELITGTRLYSELLSSAGRNGISGAEIQSLAGLVSDVAEKIGPLLDRIVVTFHQYTNHDLGHSKNLLDHMGRFIPPETLEKLNALELTFLLLSAMLHDSGMEASDIEVAATLASEEFRHFRDRTQAERVKSAQAARAVGQESRARALEDAVLAEYYRRLHPERVRKVLAEQFPGRFQFRSVDFSRELGNLCESHAWGVRESNDPRAPEKSVAKLDPEEPISTVSVNLQYLACCLRVADILDFDRSRTPLAVYQHIAFTEQESWKEWNKHLEVETWQGDGEILHITVEGPTRYFVIRKLLESDVHWLQRADQEPQGGPPWTSGTRVIVHLRDTEGLGVKGVLRAFAANVDYPVRVWRGRGRRPQVIPSFFWEEPVIPAADQLETVVWNPDAWDEGNNPENLACVFTPVRVPFEKWAFSRHLRGRAWFWLLRNPRGQPCPQRGYLQVCQKLGLAGALPGILKNLFRPRGSYTELFDRLIVKIGSVGSSGAPRTERGRQVSELICAESKGLAQAPRKEVEAILGGWLLLDDGERDDLFEALASRDGAPPLAWYEAEGVPEGLREGRRDWLLAAAHCGGVSGLGLEEQFGGGQAPDDVALHGIRIPGGFVKWRPEEGFAYKREPLSYLGGVEVDLRGMDAPTPAASRLFVPSDAMEATLFPLYRAVLRHALDLSEDRPRDEGWEPWLSHLLSELFRWSPALSELEEEWAILCRRGRCEIWLQGDRRFVPRADLPLHFEGGSIPVHNPHTEQYEDGLMADSGLNCFLLQRDFGSARNLNLERLVSLDP